MLGTHIRQFLVAGILFGGGADPARAQLQALSPNIEVGIVHGGQKLTRRFELVNRGTEPLEITEVQRGCGCLATQIDQRKLPPGGKAVLTLELRTLGQADGQHTWGLHVQYRAGGQMKNLALSVHGIVHSEVKVQPAILGLHVTKMVQQEITLTDARAKPLRVVAVDARAPGVQVTTIERSGKTTKIVVTADGSALTAGRHDGTLTITTNDADYGQLTIPIILTKESEAKVSCLPEQVELRVSRNAPSASAVVRLRSAGDQAVRITKIEPSDPSLSCTWAPGPGNDATLRVQAQAAQTQGATSCQVTVYFASPADQSIVIPVALRSDE